MRHEPSCQEKTGGGAAGSGRPQFGIFSLFVIHTEKNESRCRSGEKEENKGEKQPSKTDLRGILSNICKARYTEQQGNLGFHDTNIPKGINSLTGWVKPHWVGPIFLAGLHAN